MMENITELSTKIVRYCQANDFEQSVGYVAGLLSQRAEIPNMERRYELLCAKIQARTRQRNEMDGEIEALHRQAGELERELSRATQPPA